MRHRSLSAIEIAEGALLADVAVIFQLLWLYLPLLGAFFRLLIPIVFTVLVLRRRLYAGVMALCVTICLAGIVMGPNVVDLTYLLLEGIGGLFLGVTMRRRVPDPLILLLGTTGLAIGLYAVAWLLILAFGLPVSDVVASLRHDELRVATAAGLLAARVGLGPWWRTVAYPAFDPLVSLGFVYWWALLFAAEWVVACPVNVVMYYVTNLLVRMLGYDVRPFPGGRLERLGRRLGRRFARAARRRRLALAGGRVGGAP